MTQPLDPLTFPLRGIRLIEASAGTGKTYTIAALYLRLVLGHGGDNGFGSPLTPPQILVVTFTNAATQELRDRIRRRLTRAAAFFCGTDEGDAFLDGLRNAYPDDQWLGCARILDQAAQWMDEAAIHTIHSWSQRMLRQHAFDSGTLFDLTLEPDDKALLEAAAYDYWRSHLYPLPSDLLTEIIDLIGCSTPAKLLARVQPLLSHPSEQDEDPFAMLEQRRQAIETARRQWAADLDQAVDQVRRARQDKVLSGNKYRPASLEKWIGQITDWVNGQGPLPETQALAKLSASGLAAGGNKNQAVPEHAAYTALDQLNRRLADLNVDSALLRHAARDIGRRFEHEKQERGQMGYDDLLTRLNHALHRPGNQRLAGLMLQQYPVALIDEFQDTDPVQYGTFQKIYDGRPEAGLFMIGDPKQAIYAFRGADIHTYLEARQATEGRHYTLGRNYRATQGLVSAVNRIFAQAAEHPDGAFMFKAQIPFEAVSAEGREERFVVGNQSVKSLHWWLLPQTAPVPKTGDHGYVAQMAEAFASQMVRLLNLARQQPPLAGFEAPGVPLKPLSPADIAVLVKDGREAQAIRQALEKRRVPSVYLSDKGSIFNSEEAKQMRYLLRACAHPRHEGHLRAALATPVLERPLAWLEGLNLDETAWEAEIERFGRYQQIWQRRGILPVIRQLLHDFEVPARLLSRSGGERALTNWLHMAELLQTASAGLDGEAALIRWLDEKIDQPPMGADDHLLRLESDAHRIRVITIHKSKGLEYPLVFLPFICSFSRVTKGRSPVVRYHDTHGRLKVVADPEAQDVKAADRERLAEDLRLLYVALTRARHACWMGIGVLGQIRKKGETSHLHLSGIGHLISGGKALPVSRLPERLTRLKGDCEDIVMAPLPAPDPTVYAAQPTEGPPAPALEVVRPAPADWWISSYSAIVAGAGRTAAHSAVEDHLQEVFKEHATAGSPGSESLTIHHFPRGPQPGTFLHALLEWAAEKGFGNVADDLPRIQAKLEQLCTPRGWDPWVTPLTQWLQRLLRLPLKLPQSRSAVSLADLAQADYQAELEFMLAAHDVETRRLDESVTAAVVSGAERPPLQPIGVNGMLKGFIDLAFCHQGRYYVLDYKSNHLGEDIQAYSPDAMAEAMMEHRYDLQYVLYTLAMHRLLKARLPDYDYHRHMGGAVYLFLRGIDREGQGVYVDRPPKSLIEQLDGDFAGRKEAHVP